MPNMHSLFLFEHKLDEFLFTPIGEEENGMVLNVMSAFARRNVDPWEEAARLSRLPRDVADVAGTTLHTARAGLLVSHGRRLTIRDPTELLRIAEEATESLRP